MCDLVNNPLYVELRLSSDKPVVRTARVPPLSGRKSPATPTSTSSDFKRFTWQDKTFSTYGHANLDLLPILLGEVIETTLLMYPLTADAGSRLPCWPNLARVSLDARVRHPKDFPLESFLDQYSGTNLLIMTMESVYNARPHEDANLSAATLMPKFSQKNFETAFFRGGTRKNAPDTDVYKKWQSLNEHDGFGILSNYSLGRNLRQITNKSHLDTRKYFSVNMPAHEYSRIAWNSFNRSFIYRRSEEAMVEFITKYKVWPVEILFAPPTVTSRQTKSGDKFALRGMAFLDVASFTYPGVTEIRVAAPVYHFDLDTFMELTNLRGSLFPDEEVNPTDRGLKEATKSRQQTPHSTEFTVASEERKGPRKLLGANGDAIFLTFEIQFKYPLVKKFEIENLFSKLNHMLPHRPDAWPMIEDAEASEKKYNEAIRHLMTCVQLEFVKFRNNNGFSDYAFPGDDEMGAFMRSFGKSKIYPESTTSLTVIIADYINRVCKVGHNFNSKIAFEDFVGNTYTHLVDKMHRVVNEWWPPAAAPRTVPINEIKYFAFEAAALKDYKTALRLHQERISNNSGLPDAWLHLAIAYLEQYEVDEAEACFLELLQMDPRNRLGLLSYGMLLVSRGEVTSAEPFFLAVTLLYPDFPEGWLACHCFYQRIEYFEGADVTIKEGYKSFSVAAEETDTEILTMQQFLWFPEEVPHDKYFLRGASLFLRLRAFDFVELALAQEVICHGTSPVQEYLLAVSHFYQGRYENCLAHVNDLIQQVGPAYYLMTLQGECLLLTGDIEGGIESHSIAASAFKKSPNLTISHLRYGEHLLKIGDYDRARHQFFAAVQVKPTPRSWRGIGVACYRAGIYEEGERCLNESNYLDRGDAETWAHLALFSLRLNKKREFKDCYLNALKTDLSNEDLIQEIRSMQVDIEPEDSLDLINFEKCYCVKTDNPRESSLPPTEAISVRDESETIFKTDINNIM